jgi:DNA-binding MarR family transcriptional regulator
VPASKALQHATELARLIGRVQRLNRSRVSHALAQHGLSLHDWQVIANVKWQGPMTQGALAEHIGSHAASVSRLLDSLEERGLIERVGDAKDRRCIGVHLTARGEAWYAKWHLLPMGQMRAVMSLLDGAEQRRLEKLLRKLIG